MKSKFAFTFALVFLISATIAYAENNVTVYFFWGDGCPHCSAEKPFLGELQKEYPQLNVKSLEIWHNKTNAKLFMDMAKAYGTTAMGVPTLFIGNFPPIVGYGSDETTGKTIREKVEFCLKNRCPDPITKLSGQQQTIQTITSFQVENTSSANLRLCFHVFYTGDCPPCQEVKEFINSLEKKYHFEIMEHNVNKSEERLLYEQFKKNYGLINGAFPIAFIGNKFLVGDKAIRNNLESEIVKCLKEECTCPTEQIESSTAYPPKPTEITAENKTTLHLPVFGEIDTANMSLPIFVIIIAGLDSFNPCAFFVLFFLLSMLVYARSRKRMLIIGLTFVFFSGFIYFLFMAAWLNIFIIIGQLKAITIIAGLIALFVAVVNIKEFFFFKKGISLTIPDSAKPSLFKRMRNLLKASRLPSMILGTVVLAIAANSYELLCTAGFPMVFTRILTLHHLSITQYYLYLVLYNVIYVIPLVFIVTFFTITLGARKLTEEQGEILKLISGLMMLGLGIVLLTNPAWLNNVIAAAILLASALLVAIALVFLKKHFYQFGGEKKDESK